MDEPRRILAQVPGIVEEAEEDPERSLGSVDGERGSRLTVTIGKEARERVRSDDADLDIALEPASKLPHIREVGLPCALALPISPELRVEAFDNCRELHGFTSIRVDSQAVTMNALLPEPVNEIMRRVCEIKAIAGRCCPTVRDVAATRALCGLISVEVGIYA